MYDSAHLGHGRTYVTMDIFRRVALHLHNNNDDCNNGTPRPLYVMNITDVDDKIIKRSMEYNTKTTVEVVDPLELARYYEYEFWSDMELLNVRKPDVICRVSEHVVDTIVPYIQQIVEGGMAYVIPEGGQEEEEGSVYFDVRAFEHVTNGRTKYGKLAPDIVASTIDDFFSWDDHESKNAKSGEEERNNDASVVAENEDDEGEMIRRKKRDPRDFCLWKYRPRSTSQSSKSSSNIIEPSSVSYTSPWGPGRPGWHVECSAMIERLSNDFNKTHEFTVHAGGVDLKFPHHSNEIAQSEAYNVASRSSSRIHRSGTSKNTCSEDDNAISIGDHDDDDCGKKFKEWIPHWIHMGHLYVKGRKMSKSLKNFITIREMLGISSTSSSNNHDDDDEAAPTTSEQQNNNAWSSPADDFRLWCLGLSGAYRGPATYSKDRMEEARVIREKWIRFLMEGQECLDRWGEVDGGKNFINDRATITTIQTTNTSKANSSTRLWGDEELQLFHTVTQCSMNCRKALLDDLDGTSFVKELTRMADTGLTYVEQVNKLNSKTNNRPEEPLRFVLETLRGQLDLVGFTERTVKAGISTTGDSMSTRDLSLVKTTTSALVDETVAFRAAVRSAALKTIRKKTDGLDSAKDILNLCDKLRDDTFPKLGIEILDGKVVEKKDDASDANRGWRYCSPR